MNRPLIIVLGATGAQGGSVARALLADPERRYRVRAITRRPDGPAARMLAYLGAEIVVADLDDEHSLVNAFGGAHGVFAMTDYWEHGSPEREIRQAGHIARAARAAGIAHVVWSTLEDTRARIAADDPRFPTRAGRFKVAHLDAKAEADAAFAAEGVPTTRLYLSFFWENLFDAGLAPGRDADGGLGLRLPIGTARLPGIAVDDIGPCVRALFQRRDTVVGEAVGIAGEHPTGERMAAALARVLGEPVRFRPMRPEDFAALPFAGADELAAMFGYKAAFNDSWCAARPVAVARHLHPGLRDFDGWLARQGHRIPRAAAPRRPAMVQAALLLMAGLAALQPEPAPAAEPPPASRPAAAITAAAPLDTATPERLRRGAYLVNAAGCHDCHTPMVPGPNGPGPDMSRALSGHPSALTMPPPPKLPEGPWQVVSSATNTAFSGPWGISYASNITPDAETGLAHWTLPQFIATIRSGRQLGHGRPLLPPMPIPAYRHFDDEDLASIYHHLRTVAPVRNRVPMPVVAGR